MNQDRKNYIKQNFANLKPANLSSEDRNYYNKIKAGKSRAKQSLRIEGKFTSNIFKDKIKLDAEASGLPHTYKSLQTFLDQNLNVYERLYKSQGLTSTEKGTSSIASDIKKSNNSIFIDRGDGPIEVSKEEAIYQIFRTEQFFSSNFDIGGFSVRYKEMFDGRMIINLPPLDETLFDGMDEEEIIDMLENEFGVTVYAIYNGMNLRPEDDKLVHFGRKKAICGSESDNLTTDKSKVTCKPCRNKLLRLSKVKLIDKKVEDAKANLSKGRAKRRKH